MPDPAQMPFLLLPRVKRLIPMEGRAVIRPVHERLAPPDAVPGAKSNAEAYRLQLDPTGATIEGSTAFAFRNGRATLAQIERQYGLQPPACLIEDWPAFPNRGVMLDISRDRVPTMEHLAEIVDQLAALKINHLQLYTEHTFAYAGHQEVWAGASPMTPTQVRALDRLCKDRGIELAANQNCFGHLSSWLRLAQYRHLAEVEGDWTFETDAGEKIPRSGPFSLCPIDPRSLDLVDDLLSQLVPCFSSNLVNIGCDETFDVGQGRSKEAVARESRTSVCARYIGQVVNILKANGRLAMFWADVLRDGTSGDDGYIQPRDAIPLIWGYEPDSPLAEQAGWLWFLGYKPWYCPGTSSWRSITGRTTERRGNLAAAVKVCSVASGMLICDWGDMGHRQQWPISLHAMAEAADAAWTGSATGFDSAATGLHVFGDSVIGAWLDELGDADVSLRQVSGKLGTRGERRPLRNASALFTDLHRPPTDGPGPGSAKDWQEVHARLTDLQSRVSPSSKPLVGDELRHTVDVALWAARRAVALRNNLTSADAASLAGEGDRILADHRRLWLLRSRPGGLDRSSQHYHDVINSLRT